MRALRANGVIAMQATVAKNPSAMTRGAVSVGGSRPKWSIEMFPGRGDGQKNRRLGAFSFRFLNRPIEKRAECAQECAQTSVPKTKTRRRTTHACGCI